MGNPVAEQRDPAPWGDELQRWVPTFRGAQAVGLSLAIISSLEVVP